MKKWKVIVVDDEVEIADYVGDIVKGILGEEADVEIYYSGTRTKKRMEEIALDLLITDVVMPVTDGFQLLEHLVECQPEAEAILLTAYEEFDYIYRANKIKPCSYIVKAESEDVIRKGIQETIHHLEMKRENQETVNTARKQMEEVKNIFSEEKVKQMVTYEGEIGNEQEIIRKIKSYIKENRKEDITAASVAEKFHYSPAYLSKLFKTYGNEKLSVYIMYQKLQEAKKMLLETDMSVQQIGVELGYQSPQAFARAFRRELGMTPQEYRRMYVK
ncbi:MAG: DNA-binding response regulator [Bacillota bacterium]|nr:DNA-binding response regulator [Bacillota bacterium]